ncbi:MAG TPA: hypothetical protein VL574_09770 [Stellaceae bacterium]|nr:hypothetical protein [Stellaceae bacterium]
MRKSKSILLGAFLALAAFMGMPTKAHAQGAITQPRMLIYAGPLNREYLGCLNCDQYDVNSVWNGYSANGWDDIYASFSHFEVYRRAHGQYSACDPNATKPPRLVDTSRKFYGFLNVNTQRLDSICGPNGSQAMCEKLTDMCRRENDPLQAEMPQ